MKFLNLKLNGGIILIIDWNMVVVQVTSILKVMEIKFTL